MFTSVRKFKGLEADAIFMVDVDSRTFADTVARNLFYVGASRAKHYFNIAAILSTEEIKQLASSLSDGTSNPMSRIASSLKMKIEKDK